MEARPAAIGYARAAMDDPADAAMHAYYALGGEQDRLSEGDGVVEFERTKEILLRHLPDPPRWSPTSAVVPAAMRCGWPGVATGSSTVIWSRSTSTSSAAAAGLPQVRTAVGDARDAVLLLGALPAPPPGPGAGLARPAGVRPGGGVRGRHLPVAPPPQLRCLYEELPDPGGDAPVERTGFIPPLFYQSFTGYCHRPASSGPSPRAGLEIVDLVAVEGLAFALSDLDERMADPVGRAVVLDAARAIERVPELLGLGPHLLATTRRPGAERPPGPRVRG